MRKVNYALLPPAADKAKFDQLCQLLLAGLFPKTRVFWKSNDPRNWLKGIAVSKRFGFCQFATWLVTRHYRKWLKFGSHIALSDDPEVRDRRIVRFDGPIRYAYNYNCPPSSCRYRLTRSIMMQLVADKRAHPLPCRSKVCPHCHFRRSIRMSKKARTAVKRVSSYYQNLHGFVYEVKFDRSETPAQIRAFAQDLMKRIKRHKCYLGAFWYFRPCLPKPNEDPIWVFRILVAGGGSFHLDREGLNRDVEMLRTWPLKGFAIIKLVAKALSWGYYPFWYTDDISPLWNQFLAGEDSFRSYGCFVPKSDPAIFGRFKRYNGKKRGRKLFPFSGHNTGTSSQPAVS